MTTRMTFYLYRNGQRYTAHAIQEQIPAHGLPDLEPRFEDGLISFRLADGTPLTQVDEYTFRAGDLLFSTQE